MEDVSELQELVKDQLSRHKASKTRAPLFASTLPKQSRLTFADSASVQSTTSELTTLPLNPVSLRYDPYTEYQRSTRVIKHSNDKFVVDTDYPDHGSVGSDLRSSIASKKSSRPRFPEYSSMNATSSAAYWKGKSKGRVRKVVLRKLNHQVDSSTESLPGANYEQIFRVDSDSSTLQSLQSRSINDAFSTVFNEREITSKELDSERFFTSKIATPRLIQHDPEAPFKSKDMLNNLIEDVSLMSTSSLGTKGLSLSHGSVGTLREWKGLYQAENANYDSAALYAEIRYLELKAAEKEHGPRPSKLKATVCADLLMKLCTSTGRYAKVMEPILWELLNCVFMDFVGQEKRLRGEEPLKALYAMTTYFDKHREQTELYDDIQNELEMVQQGLQMSEIVKKFQTIKMVFHAGNFFHRDVSFSLWKGEMLRARKRRRTALRRALLYRWRIWRAYLRRYKAEVVEDMDVELDRKLESLAKLQQLLQAHNNGTAAVPPPMSTPSTPAPMRRGDSFSSPAPMRRGDSFSSPMARSSKIALSAVTEAAEEKAPDTRSGSPSQSMTPSGTVVPGAPPLSPGAMLQMRSGSGKFFLRDRGNVLPTLARQPSGGFASGSGGSPQLSAPAAPLSAKELKKQQEQKLGQRKKMLEDVDNSIRETLSSMTLRPQEEAGLHALQPISSVATLDAEDGTGSAQPSKVTVDLIKEAALLATTILCPVKNQMTQTPDVWMTNVNEQPFVMPTVATMMRTGTSMVRPGGGISRQNSGIRMMGSPGPVAGKKPGSPNGAPTGRKVSSSVGGASSKEVAFEGGKADGQVDIGGFNPPPFKLETAAACQLVTYVYESKLRAALEDHDEINFYECLPLLEYSKEVLQKRYGLKRLADKFFKGLMACVIKEGIINRRLETFARLCGLTLDGHKEGHLNFNESQCSFFFRAIGILFGQNVHLLTQCMNSFEVDREIVLEVLPDLFPSIERRDPELSKNIMFEVVDLPRNTPGNDFEYKVNFDDLMGLLMDYFEDEHRYDETDAFLDEPLIPVPVEVAVTVVKPQSPEQLKALATLTDFAKPKPAAQTPKRRVIHSSQALV